MIAQVKIPVAAMSGMRRLQKIARTKVINPHNFSFQGCGVGLRPSHYPFILENASLHVDWFEAISENYMDSGGQPHSKLLAVRERFPVALHGVSLSLGSTDPLNLDYLKNLKGLIERVEPFIVSDHLCWTAVEGHNTHDLMPLPFNQEALLHIVDRISRVQDILAQRILLENVSSYVSFDMSEMSEWEFLASVAKQSGCGILLDVNNVFVNAHNHFFDAKTYLNALPKESIGQIHLAGHSIRGDFLFDDHGSAVIDPVWELYRYACQLYGKVSTLVEWDDGVPEFNILAQEAMKAKKILNHVC